MKLKTMISQGVERKSKSLYIFRHGKSTWSIDGVDDADRPLKKRGISGVYSTANKIKTLGDKPDLIITSPAIRALHSSVIVSGVLGYPIEEIKLNSEMYLAEEVEILRLIHGINNDVNSLMIFGHNPGFTFLVNMISDLNIDNLVTSACVKLCYKTKDWQKIAKKELSSVELFLPENN
jgi:phosphohistidine phosphatase